jgi:hypothetical protein
MDRNIHLKRHLRSNYEYSTLLESHEVEYMVMAKIQVGGLNATNYSVPMAEQSSYTAKAASFSLLNLDL